MKNPYPWTTGPTAPYLDNKRFRVHYRARKDEWTPWETFVGETVMPNKFAAEARIYRKIRENNPNIQLEINRVEEVSAEAPIQTGREVKTVSESERTSQIEEAVEKTEYERKEMLRAKGIIPS